MRFPHWTIFTVPIVAVLLCGPSRADESDLGWSTFLGGSGGEEGRGIALLDGYVYVVGGTWSDDFPLTAGAMDTSNIGGYYDAFVTKLNPQGSALVFSTYIWAENIARRRMPSLWTIPTTSTSPAIPTRTTSRPRLGLSRLPWPVTSTCSWPS